MPYLILLLVCLTGCASAKTTPAAATVTTDSLQEFRGTYSAGFEELSFQPCNSSERWWVADGGPLPKAYADAGAQQYEPVFVVVRGDTSRLGQVGHMGMFQRYLRVREVVRIGKPGDKPKPGLRCE